MALRRILLGGLVALLLGAVAMTALSASRFLRDGVSLGVLQPTLAQALADALPAIDITFGSLHARWGGWRRGVDLVARDVRIGTNDFEAKLPELVLKLSLRALARGRLLPSEVELVGVAGKIVRDRAGRLRLAAVGPTQTRAIEAEALALLLGDLGAPPDPDRPLTYMRHLRLRDASFVLEDRALGASWYAEAIDVVVDAGQEQVAGVFRARLALDAAEAPVEGDIGYVDATRRLRVDMRFGGVPFDSIATRLPALATQVRMRADLDGEVGAEVSLAGRLETLDFDIVASPGSLAVAGWLDAPEPLASAALRGRYAAATSRAHLDELRLDFGDPAGPTPRFHANAVMTPNRDTIVVDAELGAAQLALSDLPRFWPETVANGTRAWIVDNIRTGSVPSVSVAAELDVHLEEAPRVGLRRLGGELQFQDLSVRWDHEAPTITGVSGHGSIAPTALGFDVEGGNAGGVTIRSARVDITEIGQGPARLEIDLHADGQVAAALRAAKLRAPEFLPIDADPTPDRCRADFRAQIGFHLDGHVHFDDLDLIVAADLAEVPVATDLARGRTSGRIDFTASDGQCRLHADADLKDLDAQVAILGWKKPAGETGRARIDLVLGEHGVESMPVFEVETAAAAAHGRARFRVPGGRLEALQISSLQAGRTRLAGAELRWGSQGLDVDLDGGTLDLEPWFQRGRSESADDAERPDPLGGAGDVRVVARNVERLYLGTDGWLEAVTGEVERAAGDWRRIAIEGQVPAAPSGARRTTPATVRLRFAPGLTGQSLELTTDDFGGLNRVAFGSGAITGGSLQLLSSDLSPGLDAGTVRVEARSFQVRDTPLVVRLLSLASLESLVTAMQGEALGFDRLWGDIQLAGPKLHTEALRAHGSSLGWTARGSYHREDASVDINGILIPAWAANRLLSSVPVLREMVVGEGLFAVDFHIGGSLAHAEIDVHPMSALTPELLRGIFGYADAPAR